MKTVLRLCEPEMTTPVSWNDLKNNKYRYKNLNEVSGGRFSTVYFAEDTFFNNKKVVIKLQKRGKDNRETFEDELKIFKELLKTEEYSPYVIELLDYFTVNVPTDIKKRIKENTKEYPYDRLCLVFDQMKCDLLKLKDNIYESGLPVSIVKNIARDTLMGLKFLHDNSIMHTDIKPENVLIGENTEVKIADLGNSCFFTKHQNDTISTCEYRSPESIICAPYDKKSDIWSLACLIFELLTDDYLFDSHQFLEEESETESEPEEESEPESEEEEESEEESELEETEEKYQIESKEILINIQHLHLMEMTLGKLPKYLSKRSPDYHLYFHRKGNLKNPVEKVDKMSISESLEYDYNFSKETAKEIEDFLKPMLKYDLLERASADDMLKHSWLK